MDVIDTVITATKVNSAAQHRADIRHVFDLVLDAGAPRNMRSSRIRHFGHGRQLIAVGNAAHGVPRTGCYSHHVAHGVGGRIALVPRRLHTVQTLCS